jgi:glycerophosphoryl diester phosphodiesterase
MRRFRMWKLVVPGVMIFGVSLYLLNASWLAAAPSGQVTLIAQRGLHQTYSTDDIDNDTCTARRILPPVHLMIDNTLPSIAAAFALGADVVEIDVRRTKDDQFVLFHDYALDCRTDAMGPVAEHTALELKAVDVGFGYTADGGKTFPLRSKGIGMMPTLADALSAHPNSRFLIQIKDNDRKTGELVVRYLEQRGLSQWDRLAFFGSNRALIRLKALRPEAHTWSAGSTAHCLTQYMKFGWTGYVPNVCNDGMIVVPISQSWLLWGWPDRFLIRMRAHRAEVLLIGRIEDLNDANFSRLDTLKDLAQIPPGFVGAVWTDRIDIIAPALEQQTGRKLN